MELFVKLLGEKGKLLSKKRSIFDLTEGLVTLWKSQWHSFSNNASKNKCTAIDTRIQ